jgi:hypothetical protein
VSVKVDGLTPEEAVEAIVEALERTEPNSHP